MWTFSEIENLNSPDKGQKDSILSHLLQIGSTWPDVLCETADELEELGPPWVCCFAQLPYPLVLEREKYIVTGATEGVSVHLDFQLIALEVDKCKIKLTPVNPHPPGLNSGHALGTQVRGFIQLWGRSVDYYRNYQLCLHSNGLEDQIVNPQVSKWKSLHGQYKGRIVTSRVFEGEIAFKLNRELVYALGRFLPNYSLVSLQETPLNLEPYSYFVMSSPGRVAYRERPQPMLQALLRRVKVMPNTAIPKERLDRALRFGIREIDRYLHQLLAMYRVAKEGEPELAVVGCAAAIEWYMNSFIEHEDEWQGSVRDCLKEAIFKKFPEDLKQHLREVALQRNDIVHGRSPERTGHKRKTSRKPKIKPKSIEEIVAIGLRLYREINQRGIEPIRASGYGQGT